VGRLEVLLVVLLVGLLEVRLEVHWEVGLSMTLEGRLACRGVVHACHRVGLVLEGLVLEGLGREDLDLVVSGLEGLGQVVFGRCSCLFSLDLPV